MVGLLNFRSSNYLRSFGGIILQVIEPSNSHYGRSCWLCYWQHKNSICANFFLRAFSCFLCYLVYWVCLSLLIRNYYRQRCLNLIENNRMEWLCLLWSSIHGILLYLGSMFLYCLFIVYNNCVCMHLVLDMGGRKEGWRGWWRRRYLTCILLGLEISFRIFGLWIFLASHSMDALNPLWVF